MSPTLVYLHRHLGVTIQRDETFWFFGWEEVAGAPLLAASVFIQSDSETTAPPPGQHK